VCALQSSAPVIVYVRPEDEFFHKHATASFTFPIEGRAVGKDELQPLRMVMLVPANKVDSARWVGATEWGGGMRQSTCVRVYVGGGEPTKRMARGSWGTVDTDL
jgi:hypothetical protein